LDEQAWNSTILSDNNPCNTRSSPPSPPIKTIFSVLVAAHAEPSFRRITHRLQSSTSYSIDRRPITIFLFSLPCSKSIQLIIQERKGYGRCNTHSTVDIGAPLASRQGLDNYILRRQTAPSYAAVLCETPVTAIDCSGLTESCLQLAADGKRALPRALLQTLSDGKSVVAR
jgi:hypothetical protein